jgi:hypothetical protein
MNGSLVICSACGCHVRTTETVCPHCRADLMIENGIRVPHRTRIEIRRMVFAVAFAGMGTVSCGNNRDPQVWGSCLQYDSCSNSNCTCSLSAFCDPYKGECVACRCDAGVANNCTAGPSGQCYHHCYGAPPVLLARVVVPFQTLAL